MLCTLNEYYIVAIDEEFACRTANLPLNKSFQFQQMQKQFTIIMIFASCKKLLRNHSFFAYILIEGYNLSNSCSTTHISNGVHPNSEKENHVTPTDNKANVETRIEINSQKKD